MSLHRIATRIPSAGVGEVNIHTEPDLLGTVIEDAAHFPGGHAAGVAQPMNESDVAALVQRATRLLPVGAQSSLTGGATPRGDVVMDMQRFDRIVAIGSDTVTVQPGVPIGVLQAALFRDGKYYPPVPTFDGAFAGGVVATNAAGATTFKYGTTRDWVRALTVVLPSGEILDLTRGATIAHPDGYFEIVTPDEVRRVPVPTYNVPAVEKCSAGYYAEPEMDLVDLFVGSEGTLGIITEITFAVVSPVPEVALVWIPLASEQAALDVTRMLRQAAKNTWRNREVNALDVAAIEHLDDRSLAIVREDGATRHNEISLPDTTQVAILAQVELPADTARHPDAAYAEIGVALNADAPDTPLTRLCRLLAPTGLLAATEIALPSNRRRQSQLTAIRDAVPEGVNRRVGEAKRLCNGAIQKTAADMIVPFDRLADGLAVFRSAFGSRGLDYAIWGHISDGNVHPNVIPRSLDDVKHGKEAILECGREIVRLGGCPLAEHGVGRNPVKQELLRQLYGNEGIAEMRAVKTALDPAGKLAPGVVFSPSEE